MFLNFIGRQEELNILNKRFKSKEFEHIVIYGRRRVGKTTLIKQFIENKDSIYFLCDKAGTEKNGGRLKGKVARFLGEPSIESNDLYDIFENLVNKSNKRVVIVIDEFPYLVEKDDSIPSIFQNIIDEILKNGNIMLILCGSSMSMMEKGVLSEKSPLYGRKTGHIKLQELDFNDASHFFPKNSPERNVEFFSVTGGVPHYLEKFSEKVDTIENIYNEIFSKGGRLYEEVEFILKQEFREPDVYKTILLAISSGCTRVVDIANRSFIPANDLPKYLRSLIALGIIQKEFSIQDFKKKKPRYYMKDNLMNFYFTFCEPFKSELEVEDLDLPMDYLKKNFISYVGKRFEEVIRDQYVRKVIPFRPQEIKRLWFGEIEIDAVAMDRINKRNAFIEIKFKDRVSPKEIKENLISKVENLPIKLQGKSYILIAKSFTRKIEGCYSFKDLLAM